jgi:hypothetical protein
MKMILSSLLGGCRHTFPERPAQLPSLCEDQGLVSRAGEELIR